MRFRPRRANEIIRLNNNFAKIEGIDDNDRFIYSIDYYVNIGRAISAGTTRIRVTVYPQDPRADVNTLISAQTSAELVSRVVTMGADQSRAIAEARANPLSTTNFDISKKINNQIASRLARNPGSENQLIGTEKVLKAVPIEQVDRGLAPGSVELSVSKQDKYFSFQNQSLKLSAIEAILEDGVDPSSIALKEFPLITTKNSIQGTSGTTAWAGAELRLAKQSSAVKSILNNFQLGGKFMTQTIEVPGSGASAITQTQVSNERINWKFYEDFMAIPDPAQLDIDSLYFVFEVLDKNGTIVGKVFKVVDHSTLLQAYYTPRKPPLISGTQNSSLLLGKSTLTIKQLDPVADSIDLYRSTINPTTSELQSRYKFVSNIPVNMSDGEVVYQDIAAINGAATVYRAVPVGPGNRTGYNFRSCVVMTPRLVPNKRVSRKGLEYVSILTQTVSQSNTVEVTITNIPSGATAVYVVATDISSAARTERIVGRDTTDQIKSVNSRSVTFIDSEVRNGHRYVYSCTIIFRNGRQIVSKNPAVHHFLSDSRREKFIISHSAPVANSTRVAFELVADYTDAGLNSVVTSLNAAGIETDYDELVKENREKYQALLAFEVLRQDETAGVVESFGVVPANSQFIDDINSRRNAGVSGLVLGHAYRYILNLCARDPGTFFTQTADKRVDITTGKPYVDHVYKYRNPFTLASGILPSTAQAGGTSDVSGLKSRNLFLQAKTAITMTVEVDLSRSAAAIDNIQAVKIDDDENLISWSLSASTDLIDHFLVLAEIGGIKSILGATHAPARTRSAIYFDSELAAVVGTVTYSVVPVFRNYIYGIESARVSVTNKGDVPSFVTG